MGFLPHQVLSQQEGGASQDVLGGVFLGWFWVFFFSVQKSFPGSKTLVENSELGSPGNVSLGLDLGSNPGISVPGGVQGGNRSQFGFFDPGDFPQIQGFWNSCFAL